MRRCLILIVILILASPIFISAQVEWTEHTIDAEYGGVWDSYAIDLDDDSDVDVLGVSRSGDDIVWWENDGSENFTIDTITTSFDGACNVYVIDLDDDDDDDILCAGFFADAIAWWENDGDENFSMHIIANNFDGAISVCAIDVNDDGDIDVLGAANAADDITWWENDGGENFTEHTIAGNFDGAKAVYAIDLDDDGDIDVLGAANAADDITWWENDGDENFTEHTIAGSFDGACYIYAIDIDADNDLDIVGAATDAQDITWWENDGNENFTEHTITGDFFFVLDAYAIDLDNDDDVDVLGAGSNNIRWWENDGNQNFTEHTIAGVFNYANSVYAIDMDDDNDVDVLGTSYNFHDVRWWASNLQALDAAMVSIDISENLSANTTLNPKATVTNLGSDDADFSVVCEIEPGVYVSTETVTDLSPDDTIQVTFTNPFTFEGGLYTVTVYTQLTSDDNSANDTLEKVIEASTTDVGPISIDIPAIVPQDTTLNPQATIKNMGTYTETFPVTCTIEPGTYMKTQTIHDLAPGESTQVTFFTEFTFESGTYTVTVYSRLSSDEYPTNDTLEKIVQTPDPSVAEERLDTPETFSFSAPTISRDLVHIQLALPEATRVDLAVYDIIGRLSETLISDRFPAGHYNLHVNIDLAAGVYFYKLKTSSGDNVIAKFLVIE
jgi:hypothetical protein